METEFIAEDWFSVNVPVWENLLGYFRGMPDLQFLEIGSFEGRSSCWMLQNLLTHPSSRLTCVDLFEVGRDSCEINHAKGVRLPDDFDVSARFDRNIEAVGQTEKVTKLKGDSRTILRTLPQKHFDLIYIDGSHTTRDALTDAVLAFDLLKINGVMIFDDYVWEWFSDEPLKNPRRGIDAFLECFEGECVPFWKERQVFIRRRFDPHADAPEAALLT